MAILGRHPIIRGLSLASMIACAATSADEPVFFSPAPPSALSEHPLALPATTADRLILIIPDSRPGFNEIVAEAFPDALMSHASVRASSDVFVLNWVDPQLDGLPAAAAGRARSLAPNLSHRIHESGWKRVHIIGAGTSAGLAAELSSSLADAGVQSQLTLLDAYFSPGDLLPHQNLGVIAQHIVDHRESQFGLSGTNWIIPTAVNIDVTSLGEAYSDVLYPESMNWPAQWYLYTILNPKVFPAGFGPSLNADADARTDFLSLPRGTRLTLKPVGGQDSEWAVTAADDHGARSSDAEYTIHSMFTAGQAFVAAHADGGVRLGASSSHLVASVNSSPWVNFAALTEVDSEVLLLELGVQGNSSGIMSVWLDRNQDDRFRPAHGELLWQGRLSCFEPGRHELLVPLESNLPPGPYTIGIRYEAADSDCGPLEVRGIGFADPQRLFPQTEADTEWTCGLGGTWTSTSCWSQLLNGDAFPDDTNGILYNVLRSDNGGELRIGQIPDSLISINSLSYPTTRFLIEANNSLVISDHLATSESTITVYGNLVVLDGGTTDLYRTDLNALDGASVQLRSTFVDVGRYRLRASGQDSLLLFPELRTIAGVDGAVGAGVGGVVSLPMLESAVGRVELFASGSNSALYAPRLSSLSGVSLLSVADGGQLFLPPYIDLSNCTINSRSGGKINVFPPRSLAGTSLIITETLPFSLSRLTDFDRGAIEITGVTDVTFPHVATYFTDECDRWVVGTSGASLHFPILRSITSADCTFEISITEGAELDLPKLQTVSGDVSCTVNGTFRVPSLRDCGTQLEIILREGGYVDAASLTDFSGLSLEMVGGDILASSPTRWTNGYLRLIDNGPFSTSFEMLEVIDNTSIELDLEASLILPGITSIHYNSTESKSLLNDAHQTLLQLPNLQSISTEHGGFAIIARGGLVDLPQLEHISGPISLGAGRQTECVLLLPLLEQLDPGSQLSASDAGIIYAPQLTGLEGVTISIDDGGRLDIPPIQSLAGGGLEIVGDFDLDLSQLSNIDDCIVDVRNLTEFSLPAVTSYVMSAGDRFWIQGADEARFPFLSRINATSDDNLGLTLDGELVELPQEVEFVGNFYASMGGIPTLRMGGFYADQDVHVSFSNSSVYCAGDWSYAITDEERYFAHGVTGCLLTMEGGTGIDDCDIGGYRTIEAGGVDIGQSAEGFDKNFALRSLTIGPDAHILIVDEYDNSAGEVEALYVKELIFADTQGRLNTGGLPLYYETLVGSESQIIDLSPNDCNRNGRSDTCDIADGTSMDRNRNGVPDECEMRSVTGEEVEATSVDSGQW